ncbi:hypothetical protein BBP40_002168 [Aspergillus hancockii]|nr:hypothetical protein BBP40_002168 [Aspergillus hancockii]
MSPALPSRDEQGDGKRILMMEVMWSLTSFTTLIVVARVFIRRVVLRSLGLDDDYLIAVSMALELVYNATTTVAIAADYGRHITKLSIDDAEKALKWIVISYMFRILSFPLPKLGVVAFLTRLLNLSRLYRFLFWGLASLAAVVTIVNIIVYLTISDPPKPLRKPRICYSSRASCTGI